MSASYSSYWQEPQVAVLRNLLWKARGEKIGTQTLRAVFFYNFLFNGFPHLWAVRHVVEQHRCLTINSLWARVGKFRKNLKVLVWTPSFRAQSWCKLGLVSPIYLKESTFFTDHLYIRIKLSFNSHRIDLFQWVNIKMLVFRIKRMQFCNSIFVGT